MANFLPSKMLKKVFTGLLVTIWMLVGSLTMVQAQTDNPAAATGSEVVSAKVLIEMFSREECVHCQDEKAFLSQLATKRSDFEVVYYDLVNEENKNLWIKIAELEKMPKVTPITLIGDTIVQGFDKPETTGKALEELIDKNVGKPNLGFKKVVEMGGTGKIKAVAGGTCEEGATECETIDEPLFVSIPLIGSVDVSKYSLPILSFVLGFIDGFNPCAMWVLVTFLLILIQIGDRKKMWQIAGLFILAETVMYYLILNVWAQVWDFVGLDNIITPIVGTVAIGGGLFFLYEWKTSDGICKVTDLQKRHKTKSKIQKLAAAEMTLLTIFGVLGLALSVNIIEFACSIGIPQAFTKILDLNNLNGWTYQFYMLDYIFAYMLDDFIVFGIALYSIEKIGITTKYSKLCNLIGGVLMIVLGLILIFQPGWLVF